MALTDLLPDIDEFDEELAAQCGLTNDELKGDSFEPPLCNFNYIQDVWKCSSCGHEEWHEEGPRYYYNYEANWYSIDFKPLTPAEQVAKENRELEAAGQLKLWSENHE